MNEPLMHATIGVAARCAELDTPPDRREIVAMIRQLAHEHGLDRSDEDALLVIAEAIATMPDGQLALAVPSDTPSVIAGAHRAERPVLHRSVNRSFSRSRR